LGNSIGNSIRLNFLLLVIPAKAGIALEFFGSSQERFQLSLE